MDVLMSSHPAVVKQALSVLERAAVQPKTATMYKEELGHFMTFADARQLNLITDDEVDVAMVAYINHLYLTGEGSWRADRTLASLVFHDASFSKMGSRKLPRVIRALKGFHRLVPGKSRKPHSLRTWLGIAAGCCGVRSHFGSSHFGSSFLALAKFRA